MPLRIFKKSEKISVFTCLLLFCLVTLISFQKLDVAAASKYLPVEITMVKIFPEALVMLLLCKHIPCPFPFSERKGAYLEMDSRGTWTLFSVLYMYFVLNSEWIQSSSRNRTASSTDMASLFCILEAGTKPVGLSSLTRVFDA